MRIRFDGALDLRKYGIILNNLIPGNCLLYKILILGINEKSINQMTIDKAKAITLLIYDKLILEFHTIIIIMFLVDYELV